MRDVAKLAGVSPATVSRVLNRNQNVDSALTERVMRAVRELNYKPTLSAHPQPNQVKQIAVVLPTLENTYYTTMLSGIADTARENDQNVIVMQSSSNREIEDEHFSRILRSNIDGIIFSGVDGSNPYQRFPALYGIPMVFAARRQVVPGFPHVYSDNIAAGYMATKYLLRLRHRKIALLVHFWTKDIHDYDTFLKAYNSSEQGSYVSFDRYTGYCKALAEERVTVDPNLIIFSSFSHESGYASAQALLSSSQEFDAVLVSSDRCATGVHRFFKEQGLQIPSQVSIICFNGGLMSNVVSPELTIVDQNNYKIGALAAGQLNELINGCPAHDIKLDVNLIIKGSTALFNGP